MQEIIFISIAVILIVFLVLALLIFILKAFKMFSYLDKKKKKNIITTTPVKIEEKIISNNPVSEKTEIENSNDNSQEIVAAISAALSLCLENNFVIKSVKKSIPVEQPQSFSRWGSISPVVIWRKK